MTQIFCRDRFCRRLGPNGPVLEVWPSGDADFLLFYPGSMLAPGHYCLLLSALYQAGFAIAALHLRGHGRCAPKFWQLDQFTFQELLEQGLGAEQWLRGQYGKKVIAAGHSQGGIEALAHAGESSGLTAAFAICAVFPQMPEAIELTRFAPLASCRQLLLSCLQGLAKVMPRLPLPLPFYLQLGKLVAGKAKPVYMGKDRGRLTYPLKYLVSLFAAKVRQQLNCPFVLYAARDDALFSPRLIQQTFARVQAPARALVWLPAGGHMAPLNPWLAQYLARSMAEQASALAFNLTLSKEPGPCAMLV